MARAHRIHVPGQIWHLTHRCHHRRFLLKFARDRRLWRSWLFEARKRYGLCVLDYTVTSNHVHLIVRDTGRGEIPASMQLVEGCTAQAYNRRKRRGGAFWEDQYHATAIETGEHLARCLVYVDLNMVRAGVVDHPREWEVGGYHEIQQSPTRFRIVDRAALAEVLAVDPEELAAVHGDWIEHALRERQLQRDERWSECIAVGSRAFVEGVRADLGGRGRHRGIDDTGDACVLREPCGPYTPLFATEIAPPSWNPSP